MSMREIVRQAPNRKGRRKPVSSDKGGPHSSRYLKMGLGVFVLALVVRIIYLYGSSDNPTFSTPVADAQNYDLLARSLVDGKAMDGEFFWQPVFYPFFLVLVYSASGSSVILARILGALLGSITCALTYQLGSRVFDQRTGVVAGLITAFYGPLIFYEAELLATGWAVFWSVVLLLLLLKAVSARGVGFYLALGVCGALAVLTRPTFLPFFLAGGIWLGVTLHRRAVVGRSLIYRFLAVVAGYLVITTPVAFLNLDVTGHFGIMPANGGVNLYMGNNPNAAQTEATLPGLEYERLRALAAPEGADDQWSEARVFYRKTINYALTQPLDFAGGLLRKMTHLISSREIPGDEDVYLFRRWSYLLSLSTWKLHGFGFPFGVLLVLGILGWVGHRRQVPVPIVLFLVLYAASIILTHVRARYRLPLVPPMAIMAAAGVFIILETFRARRWGRVALACCGSAVVILLSSRPGPFGMERRSFEPLMYWSLGEYEKVQSGRPDKAVDYYREALRLNPDYLEAHTQLAHTLSVQGKLEDSLAHYHEARRIAPDFVGGHNNLIQALHKMGRLDEALTHAAEWARLNPKSAPAHRDLASILYEVGRTAEAISRYRMALRINSDDADAHNGLGLALYHEGRVGEAVGEYREAVRLDPGRAEIHFNLGAALAKLGRLDEAVTAYGNTLAIDPGHFGARYNLGNALRKQGKFGEAAREYRRAVRIDPAYANAHYNLGVTLVKQGELEAAAAAFREALRVDPQHGPARQGLEAVSSPKDR